MNDFNQMNLFQIIYYILSCAVVFIKRLLFDLSMLSIYAVVSAGRTIPDNYPSWLILLPALAFGFAMPLKNITTERQGRRWVVPVVIGMIVSTMAIYAAAFQESRAAHFHGIPFLHATQHVYPFIFTAVTVGMFYGLLLRMFILRGTVREFSRSGWCMALILMPIVATIGFIWPVDEEPDYESAYSTGKKASWSMPSAASTLFVVCIAVTLFYQFGPHV